MIFTKPALFLLSLTTSFSAAQETFQNFSLRYVEVTDAGEVIQKANPDLTNFIERVDENANSVMVKAGKRPNDGLRVIASVPAYHRCYWQLIPTKTTSTAYCR